MTGSNDTVFVIDDDPSVRLAIKNLLESVGLRIASFESTEDFLKASFHNGPSCLILDARLPGISGVEFQEQLTQMGWAIPIIFITAHGDVPMTRRVMKGGAIEFLTKPFQKDDLLLAIEQGLKQDRLRRQQESETSTVSLRFNSLTVREQQVMRLVVIGRMNKEIAAELELSEITVKIHRAHVMRKMQASSLPELVRMSEKLHLSDPK